MNTIASCEGCGADAMEEMAFRAQLCAACAVLVGVCRVNGAIEVDDPGEICDEVYRDMQFDMDAWGKMRMNGATLKFGGSKYIDKKDYDLIRRLRANSGIVEQREKDAHIAHLVWELKEKDDELEAAEAKLKKERKKARYKGVIGPSPLGYDGISHVEFHILRTLAKFERPMRKTHIVQDVSDYLVIDSIEVRKVLEGLYKTKLLLVGQEVEWSSGPYGYGRNLMDYTGNSLGGSDDAFYLTPAGFVKFREYCGIHHPSSDPWK